MGVEQRPENVADDGSQERPTVVVEEIPTEVVVEGVGVVEQVKPVAHTSAHLAANAPVNGKPRSLPFANGDMPDTRIMGVIAGFLLIMLLFFGGLIYVGGGITGAVVMARSAITDPSIDGAGFSFVAPVSDAYGQGIARVDVARSFSGEGLQFTSTHHEGNTETIADGIFTVSGPPGEYTYELLATDGESYLPSNTFSVVLS